MRPSRLSGLASTCVRTRRVSRALILGGVTLSVAGLAATAVPAMGQTGLGARLHAPSTPIPDDGLGQRDLLLQADTLIENKAADTVTAIGHVEARYQGRTLRADRLDYNTQTGAAHAVGHAVVVNADGTTQYGDDVVLDDQFRAAVSIGFAAREQDNVTLAAGAAVRRDEMVNQLNNAIYTTCNICAENGAPQTPSWQIQATRITEDRRHQVVYYRNAIIKVLGIPVFYSPIFWHPDPTSPRRSGFLTPRIEVSKRRGFSIEQPYLLTLGSSADLILSPQINAKVNPFLNARLTERFYSGLVDVRAGYTHEYNFDNHTKFGQDTSRSYVLARGLFNIAPDWVWGFGGERVSDPTLFQRYAIHDVYTDRGPFPADTDRLITQLYSVREDQQSYVSGAVLDFESLRAFGVDQNGHVIAESSRAFPLAAPVLEARYDPTDDVFGGRLKITGSAIALSRNDPVISVYDPTGVIPQGPQAFTSASLAGLASEPQVKQLSALEYTSSRRASAQLNWDTTLTLNNGIRIQPFVNGRVDAYSLDNPVVISGFHGQTQARSGDTILTGPNGGGLLERAGVQDPARIYGTVGATASWPFIKPLGSASIIVEPIAQLAVSPAERVNPNIPNEDSVAFEYDETNLFETDRFSGYDLIEGGDRLNVGGRATVNWGADHSFQLTIGRTFRAEEDPQFTVLSGLSGTASDWVVAATASPLSGINVFTRSRLDADDFNVRREEAGVQLTHGDDAVQVRYDLNFNGLFQIPTGATEIGRTEDIQVAGQAFLTRNWGVSANVTRDMQANLFPVAQVGLIYRNACIRVDILYTHDETFGSVIGTSNSVAFRITLATLGDNQPLGPRVQSQGSR